MQVVIVADIFRRFKPVRSKAIVDYRVLYVQVESINPTFNIASKIKAIERLHNKRPF